MALQVAITAIDTLKPGAAQTSAALVQFYASNALSGHYKREFEDQADRVVFGTLPE